MNLNSYFVLKILILCIGVNLITADLECELRSQLNRGIRDLEKNGRISGRKPIKELLQSIKQKLQRKNSESALHGLAKNIEVILSKLIPNHNLVQDLMGYVTMPRLIRKYPEMHYVPNDFI